MKKLDIKRALADHNMTQVQLGENLNVFPQSLTSVIKGNPTVKKAGGYCGGHRLRHYRSFLF